MLVLARGGDPPEPPAGSRPRSFVTRPWPCCPGGATPRNPPLARGPVPSSRDLGRAARGGDPPGTPRWLKAPFLRHETLAVLPGGATPLEPPAGSRPVPSSRDLGRAARGATPWNPAASRPCCPWGQPPEPLRGPGGQVLSRIRRELRCGVDGAKPGRDGPPLVRAVDDRGGWPTVDDPGHAEHEGGDSRDALHPRGGRRQP